jgi:carboxyl-terminal processing protease
MTFLFSAILALPPSIPGAAADLSKTYKAVLESPEDSAGSAWTAAPDDVWALKGFGYSFKGLAIQAGPSDLVIGHSGTSAVWAAVLPRKPGKIVRAPQGAGEGVTSIFLRFHPSLIGSLFPPKTLDGKGRAIALIQGRRICAAKINAAWQHDNLPVVPWKQSIVIDCETAEKNRRFYMIETRKGTVEYEPAFAGRRVPDPDATPVTKEESLEAFDAAWKAFDEDYAMFSVKKGVDWDKLKEVYRPLAEEASDRCELAGAIDALLANLEDLHIYVKLGEEYFPGYNRFRPANGSLKAVREALGGLTEAGEEIVWGRTSDGIGYIAVLGLSRKDLPEVFDRTLEGLKDSKALVLDLRFNGGGGEDLALPIAGRFIDKERVYSVNQYRSGPGRDQLGPKLERKVEPRGPWRYKAPVAVLIGRKTMSSAESFALMMAQCPQATTIGDPTAGSSANPRRLELKGGIQVNLPRWIDMDPSGKPIDVAGVQPRVPVPAPFKELKAGRDVVFKKALEILRKK